MSAALAVAVARSHGVILMAVGGASLATTAYVGVVGAVAPELALIWPLLVVLAAAAVSSIAGFAFAPICAVVLVHLVDDPLRMVTMILMASIAMQLFCVLNLRSEMNWERASVALAGGLCTLPVGLLLLLQMTGRAHVMLLGALLIFYALWMLRRPHAADKVAQSYWTDAMAGAAGGITGGLAAFPSGPLVAWFGWCGEGRVACRGIAQPYILMMQVAGLTMLYALAPARAVMAGFDLTLLLVVVPAVLGAICGLQVYVRLSDLLFARAVNLTLLGAGFAMLV